MVTTRSSIVQRMALSSGGKEFSSSVSKRKIGTTKKNAAPKPRPSKVKKPKSCSPSNQSQASTTIVSKTETEQRLLLSLPDDCILAKLLKRPSRRNRSPYVADVELLGGEQGEEGREAIAHVPNLDMGGKCVPGSLVLLKPARNSKTGKLVGSDATNPKYGTPKCEFITQLLHVDETDLSKDYEACWVGAHPSLGEKLAEVLVGENLLGPDFPKVKSFQREVRNVGGDDASNMRADFLIQHEDPKLPPRILEVKTVVDTDYSIDAIPNRDKCVFTNDSKPYVRTAIFPWGGGNQKGPDGEKVVSARAIKHVGELTRLARRETTTKKKNDKRKKTEFDATVLFVVIRHDARAFRPNFEACPSFARYLREAKDAGVQVLAKQVRWGEGKDMGKCFEGDLLPIDWPETTKS